MAAEEIGSVRMIPIMAATRMPMGRGASAVAFMTSEPSRLASAPTGGAIR